jgi:hypothetical protein
MIKSLLFIIVLIFLYESYHKLTRMKEEYFSSKSNHSINSKTADSFVSLTPDDPEKNDIAKTIAINCKNPHYPENKGLIMAVETVSGDELDTPFFAQFKPLEYNPDRQYYYRRDILIPEGMRRTKDDDKEIAAVKKLYDAETNPCRKQILEDELKLFKWRDDATVSKLKDSKTGEERSMRDIISDYYPAEIGMSRIWREPHSHIRDYSQSLNYGYKAYPPKSQGNENNNQERQNNNTNTTTATTTADLLARLKAKLCSPQCAAKIPGTVIGMNKNNPEYGKYEDSGLILSSNY